MPYEISFQKQIEIKDEDVYFNECCYGGNVIADRLLPSIRERYKDVLSNQEDWGWFIWFKKDGYKLSIDIFCDNYSAAEYRIYITSQRRRYLIFEQLVDDEEIEKIKELVLENIDEWSLNTCKVSKVGKDKY